MLYKHYKGGFYQVICIARVESSLQEVVIYKPLYPSKTEKGMFWSRPLDEFFGTFPLNANDGKGERPMRRFTPVSEKDLPKSV